MGWGGVYCSDPRSRLHAVRSVASGGRVPAWTPPVSWGSLGTPTGLGTRRLGEEELLPPPHRVQDFGSSPALSHPGMQCESSDPPGGNVPIFSHGTKSFLIPAQNRSCGDRGRAGRGLLAGGRTPSPSSRAAHQAGDSRTSHPAVRSATPTDLGTTQGPGAKGSIAAHHTWAHRAQQCPGPPTAPQGLTEAMGPGVRARSPWEPCSSLPAAAAGSHCSGSGCLG